MELDVKTLMLLFFILFLTLSIWKIWVFLPNKELKDDDRTQESQAKLLSLILKIIKETQGEITEEELFLRIKEDKDFDSKLFWRFNPNRLKHLLNSFYIKDSSIQNIHDIYISCLD
ncbi:hypothetical protein JHD47_01595 [Sulfurimonas sp. SAG-AH-194-L11]|nr:hypothetical protein [Sulfurimonas sp. SAG-AH-194-L11]MDF1876509.1 hypothetical protein [Sulfurimonas sp. SAG-AH-194-L11]